MKKALKIFRMDFFYQDESMKILLFICVPIFIVLTVFSVLLHFSDISDTSSHDVFPSFIMMYPYIIITGFQPFTIRIKNKQNGFRFLDMLPITKKDMIFIRYFFVCFTTSFFVFPIMLYAIAGLIYRTPVDWFFGFGVVFIASYYLLHAVCCCIYWLYGKQVNGLIFIHYVFFILFFFIVSFMPFTDSNIISAIFMSFQYCSGLTGFIILALTFIAGYYIAYKIPVKQLINRRGLS